jgi:hypothetical protein
MPPQVARAWLHRRPMPPSDVPLQYESSHCSGASMPEHAYRQISGRSIRDFDNFFGCRQMHPKLTV